MDDELFAADSGVQAMLVQRCWQLIAYCFQQGLLFIQHPAKVSELFSGLQQGRDFVWNWNVLAHNLVPVGGDNRPTER